MSTGTSASASASASEVMSDEFDRAAAWTEQVVAELDPGYAIPAACRGSGSPANLAWLAEALEVRADDRFLDAGAGLGGPAAWLAHRFGVRPVLAEPMPRAAAASRRMIGLPGVVAWAEHLPFATGRFDVAWCLGVLCTTARKASVLAELRRVLTPAGRLGLLVFVRTCSAPPPDAPAGNSFPGDGELAGLLEAAGFCPIQEIDAADLGAAPIPWRLRTDRVEAVLGERHRGDAAWKRVADQEERMGRLLARGDVAARLLHCVAV